MSINAMTLPRTENDLQVYLLMLMGLLAALGLALGAIINFID